MLTPRALDEAHIRALYAQALFRDFPKSEIKPLSMILRAWRASRYDVLSFEESEGGGEDGRRAAYALLFCPEGIRAPLLDYLAVEPEKRGQGVGSEALRLLRARYRTADALVIESERPESAPNEADARARLRFYGRAGAVQTGVCVRLFGVEFCILALPCGDALPDVDWKAHMRALYRAMLPELVYRTQVRFLEE